MTSSTTSQTGGSSRYEPIARSPGGLVLRAGIATPGRSTGDVGSVSVAGRSPPRWSRYSAGNGDGKTTGHIDDATDSRIRWPAANRWAVARVAIRTGVTTP